MGKKLFICLSKLRNDLSALLPTIAWLAKSKGYMFDCYIDSPRAGDHFGGGDYAIRDLGRLTGSLVSGGHHIEEFLYTLNNYDTEIHSLGETLFAGYCQAEKSKRIVELYAKVLKYFRVKPKQIVMIGSECAPYLYPEIFFRKALGVHDSLSSKDLAKLTKIRKIKCFHVAKEKIEILRRKGYEIEIIDQLNLDEDFSNTTLRILERWKHRCKGFILGDPVLVSSWIPFACASSRIALYGRPQTDVIPHMVSDNKVVLGRQYSDQDFFELSKRSMSLQVIDPVPPVFRIRRIKKLQIPKLTEPTDIELRAYAREGRILTSVVFWTGATRELENLYRIIDLIALTDLKAGIVSTTDTFKYWNSALDLIAVPKESGGVWPNIEPLLGCSGRGVCIESLMDPEILKQELIKARRELAHYTDFAPKGYWVTMDAEMKKKFVIESLNTRGVVGKVARRTGLAPKRPYDMYKPDTISKGVLDAAKHAGFEYMLTKSGFGKSKLLNQKPLVIPYTVGRWDGWTPFYTINNVSDLKKVKKGPGWILGTIDSCLWTFSGNIWDKGRELKKIADYLTSWKFVNTTPGTIARYAEIIENER